MRTFKRVFIVLFSLFALSAAHAQTKSRNDNLLWALKEVLPLAVVDDQEVTDDLINDIVEWMQKKGPYVLKADSPNLFTRMRDIIDSSDFSFDSKTFLKAEIEKLIVFANTNRNVPEFRRRLTAFQSAVRGRIHKDNPPPNPCRSVNLSPHWPRAGVPYQGNVESCHSFASTALVEEWLFRTQRVQMDLSERDLFEQHLLRQASVTPEQMAERLRSGKAIEMGSSPDFDIRLIMENGVCLESQCPYVEGNVCRMESVASQLRFINSSAADHCGNPGPATPQTLEVAKMYLQRAWSEGLADVRVNQERIESNFSDVRKSVRESLRGLNLQGVNVMAKSRAEKQNLVMSLLTQGVPIAGSFRYYNDIVDENSYDPRSKDSHAAVIVGYDCNEDKFLVRNSNNVKGYDLVSRSRLMRSLDYLTYLP